MLRQETISLIETRNPATKLETILAVLAALDLEFRIAPRSKAQAADIEDTFLCRAAANAHINEACRYIGELVTTIQPRECANYFANAGYASIKT